MFCEKCAGVKRSRPSDEGDPAVVQFVKELVDAGAKVIGNAPLAPATLKGGEKTAACFDEEVVSLWGNAAAGRVNRIGKGSLAVDMSLDEALKAFGLRPHLVCDNPDLIWSEREVDGGHSFEHPFLIKD